MITLSEEEMEFRAEILTEKMVRQLTNISKHAQFHISTSIDGRTATVWGVVVWGMEIFPLNSVMEFMETDEAPGARVKFEYDMGTYKIGFKSLLIDKQRYL